MVSCDVATRRTRGLAPVLSWQIVPRFRELRGSRTLQELSVLSGVHRGTLSQIERLDRMPRSSQLQGLAVAYGPSVSWYALVPSVPVGMSAAPASNLEKGLGLCEA